MDRGDVEFNLFSMTIKVSGSLDMEYTIMALEAVLKYCKGIKDGSLKPYLREIKPNG